MLMHEPPSDNASILGLCFHFNIYTALPDCTVFRVSALLFFRGFSAAWMVSRDGMARVAWNI